MTPEFRKGHTGTEYFVDFVFNQNTYRLDIKAESYVTKMSGVCFYWHVTSPTHAQQDLWGFSLLLATLHAGDKNSQPMTQK